LRALADAKSLRRR